MNKATISTQTRRALRSIREYYSDKNPEYGLRVVKELRALFVRLAKLPGMGTDRSALMPNLRSFPYRDYLVFFFPTENGITVAHVLHAKRNITSVDFLKSE